MHSPASVLKALSQYRVCLHRYQSNPCRYCRLVMSRHANLIWSLAINSVDSLSEKIWFVKKIQFGCSLNKA